MARKAWAFGAAGAALLLITGATVAGASIPDSGGSIHGCYKDSDLDKGSLYVIDSAETCPTGYTALNWNQTVPRSGASQDFDLSPGEHRITMLCPTGYAVFSGGWSQGADNVHIFSSRPQYTPTEGWVFDVDNTAASNAGMSFYVICTVV